MYVIKRAFILPVLVLLVLGSALNILPARAQSEEPDALAENPEAQTSGVVPSQGEVFHTCVPIKKVPVTILFPGNYCLTQNLTVSLITGGAIVIATGSVVLDLNGFKLSNISIPQITTACGICTPGDQVARNDITIRNGTVQGFWIGVGLGNPLLPTSLGIVIENLRAEGNTLRGLGIAGNGFIIRDSHVINTGGTSLVPPGEGISGIGVAGSNGQITNNLVTDTLGTPGGLDAGIGLVTCNSCVVENNRILNTTLETPSAISAGIGMIGSLNVMVINNRITSRAIGIYYDDGTVLQPPSTGKFRENLTGNVTTPFVGGTNVAPND